MRNYRSALIGFIATAILASPAAAENVLRFTSISGGAVTMDPHSLYEAENRVATEQVYEALLDIDSNLAIVPQLALAWKPLNPTTWEFELRPDVTFHDGTPFTAADVVFSIERARAEGSDVSVFVDGIATVEAIDDHTVRFTTTGPDPSLWLKLAEVAIMSRAWAQEHDVTKPADVDRARQKRPTPRATPTAPARSCSKSSSPTAAGSWSAIPSWWGTADYPHNIDRIVHIWKDDPENVAALLEGEIDLLQAVPYSGPRPDPPHPRPEACVQDKTADDVLRPRSGQRGAALVQRQGAGIRSRTNGCVRRWPTRSTSSRSSPASWVSSSSRPACWLRRASMAMRRIWTSRHPTTPKGRGRCWPRPATRTAST